MKKTELKKLLKPLIKECIKECIFEEGVLSGIITEVAKGLGTQQMIVESRTSPKKNVPDPKEIQQKADALERQRQERIKRLNESMTFGAVDIFEGTQEIIPESDQHGPLANTAPNDSGVDITGIMNLAEGKWKHLM